MYGRLWQAYTIEFVCTHVSEYIKCIMKACGSVPRTPVYQRSTYIIYTKLSAYKEKKNRYRNLKSEADEFVYVRTRGDLPRNDLDDLSCINRFLEPHRYDLVLIYINIKHIIPSR